jgi:hypothetical protein
VVMTPESASTVVPARLAMSCSVNSFAHRQCLARSRVILQAATALDRVNAAEGEHDGA